MKKHRILLVDDDPGATHVLQIALVIRGGYEVLEVNDSSKAIDTARAFQPDLVVLDAMMPGVQGEDVGYQMAMDASLQRTPVIFLTSLVSNETGKRGRTSVARFRSFSKVAPLDQILDFIEANLPKTESSET
jgi:DNA-binding response OmpR family regulator